MRKESCQHEVFDCHVEVSRLTNRGEFSADITIRCAQCNLPFQFIGLPGGLSPSSPTVSADHTEARMPIEPQFNVWRIHQ